MILKNNLYTILSEKPDEGSFLIHLNADSFVYAAHFPGMPVTPGVCVVQMVKELAEQMLGRNLIINTIKNAKFLQVMQPGSVDFHVSIAVKKQDGNSVSFQGIVSDKENNTYAKISLQTTAA